MRVAPLLGTTIRAEQNIAKVAPDQALVVRTTGNDGADGAVVAVGTFREGEHSRFVGVFQAHLQSTTRLTQHVAIFV
jgi:hypothetical protein